MSFDEVDNEEIKGIEKSGEIVDFYVENLPRGYLSVSQVVQYTKCGEAYRRRYVLEEQIPSTGFQVQGRAIHRAAELLHNSLISKKPLSRDDVADIYSDTHDTEIKEATIDEESEGSSDLLKDQGIRLTRKYHRVALGFGRDDKTGDKISPVEPVAAERLVKVRLQPDNSDPIPFVGVIDVEEDFSVGDLKTKKKAASQGETDDSLQLSLYAHITGKPHVRLDQLIRPTKTRPERFVRTESMRTKEEVGHALDVVSEVAEDIAMGRFRKTNPENWWCSSKWCPYWDKCRGRKR